jgi:hypothetical protein
LITIVLNIRTNGGILIAKVDAQHIFLSIHEIKKVLVSLAKKKIIANSHVLGLFIPKKSDALVGRV